MEKRGNVGEKSTLILVVLSTRRCIRYWTITWTAGTSVVGKAEEERRADRDVCRRFNHVVTNTIAHRLRPPSAMPKSAKKRKEKAADFSVSQDVECRAGLLIGPL